MGKCTNCGTGYAPLNGVCDTCQIQELQFQKAKLWKALSEIVGASTVFELGLLELALRVTPGIERDKIVVINGIHALLETAD